MVVASYNGWPASSDPDVIGINTAWEPIPGHRFPGGVKSGDVETVLTYVVRQLDKRVEPIDRDAIKDEWGWYFKASANSPDLISNHSSGTAFDYNATRHPNGVRGTWTQAQVAEVREILAEVGGVVRWLYDATRTPDEMHFEIRGTRSEVAAVAARLRTPTPAPPPPVTLPPEESPMLYDDPDRAGVYLVHGGKLAQFTTATDIAEVKKMAKDPSYVGKLTKAGAEQFRKVFIA